MEVEQIPTIIRVADPTHAGEARRYAAIHAERGKLGQREAGALAIIVTEITTNVVKHAGSGMMVIESLSQNGNRGVRVLGLDKGPGIRDLGSALRDGYSSAGTAGNGLGSIKRLSHTFDIYTAPGSGTAVLAEVWDRENAARRQGPVHVGAASIPIKGEDVCGDGWGVKLAGDSSLLMVVDGLGHGILASDAAREAERILAGSRSDSPTSVLQDSHEALRKTRGAAMAVSSLHLAKNLISFAGVGNISSSVVTPTTTRGMASHNGIIGHQCSKIQEFTFPWSANSILVMHSDGLKSNWDLNQYPGLWSRHPALIAGLLCRDFSRERDDVTVLIAKNHAGTSAL